MTTNYQPMTDAQLDLIITALSTPKAHAAAIRLTEASRDELAMRDRRGREDGPLYRVLEAILDGCDPAAVAEHLEREAAEVEARHASARDRLAAIRVQLDARRAHLRRHDAHVSALARVLAAEVARLEAGSVAIQNKRTREIGILMGGGFSQEQAMKAVDHAEAQEAARKLGVLASAGIAAADAKPILTDAEESERMRARAAPLRADLERVQAFQRDELRDPARLPGWVRQAVEAGALNPHDEAQIRRLIPA